ncbi:hypothetical protein T552_00769 [Pneumocystis carinii B80]|uniref:Pre-mRNA-splicing factor CWC26 n=1 Tax=Pneumocystis carinii (strain B80) TaxID=1408658 RepID=A0A0W4ZPL3_PNEC8|nr:hypothetical protein T552_00769 [Pneumocystis carinii B80]KTW30294.1 hypothetical protein T552_00769 [Pneumocystis carinii B80]
MSLASYLAEKYLNKEVIKKDKKKDIKEETVHIIDGDLTGWKEIKPDIKKKASILKKGLKKKLEKEEEGIKKGFKKASSSWEKVEESESNIEAQVTQDVIVSEEDKKENDVKMESKNEYVMSSGARAGLQTAKQVADDIELQKNQERAIFKALDPKLTGKNAKTIYRDASGRRVDIELAMIERQRQKAKEDARKKLEYEMSQGEVQKRQKEEAKKAMEAIKHEPFSRSIDDPEFNRMLKEKECWDDPAKAFLSKKQQSTRPTYKGFYSANRFGIAPGYRWDGVDRSNGFEKAWFAYRNEKKAQAAEAYAWSIEDM